MHNYSTYDVLIGIDTGKHTGMAVCYQCCNKAVSLDTLPIHKAIEQVVTICNQYNRVLVRFEDARQRKWFGANAYAKQQGAGSVKRDAVIWEDFLTDLHKEGKKKGKVIDFEAVAPKNNLTKITPEYFKFLTGYNKPTSEHARDAAGLILSFIADNRRSFVPSKTEQDAGRRGA